MKQSGPTCVEVLNEAKKAGSGERVEGNAGGDRVVWRVRQLTNTRSLTGKLSGSRQYEFFTPQIDRNNEIGQEITAKCKSDRKIEAWAATNGIFTNITEKDCSTTEFYWNLLS
jgi:hypothetical protein